MAPRSALQGRANERSHEVHKPTRQRDGPSPATRNCQKWWCKPACKHSVARTPFERKPRANCSNLGQVVAGAFLHVQNQIACDRPDKTQHTHEGQRAAHNASRAQLSDQAAASAEIFTSICNARRARLTHASNAAQNKQESRTPAPVELDPTRKDAAGALCACRTLRREASEALCKAACHERTAQRARAQANEPLTAITHTPAAAFGYHRQSDRNRARQ